MHRVPIKDLPLRGVAAVIFDMDGLMVDTEPLYKVAWQQAASELGHDLDDARYARMVGRPNEDCEHILIEQCGPSFPLAAFRERWAEVWRREVERVGLQTKPGLLELLAFIDEQGLPAAVATSSDAEYAGLTLRLAGIADRFQTVVNGDEVSQGKPAPDIYLLAARRLAVPAADCVAFEDSEAGIRAVAEAGMTGILVPHWPPSAGAIRAASWVVENLHEGREILATLIGRARSAG